MKKTYHHIRKFIQLAPVAFLLTGCSKSFLDINPKGKLIAQQTSDYDKLFNNLNLLNTSATAQVPMGDETIAVDPYFTNTNLQTQRLFQWADVIYDNGQDASEMTSIMPQLYTYNKIANEVMGSTNGSDAEKLALKGEALANRAWCYFMFSNYYGKPYDAATADKDLCFPIITEADVTLTKFTRASVKACYDMMISDLIAAIPVLSKETGTRARMCRSTAEALLGKVYVFMGRYSDALPLLKSALADLPVNTAVAFYDLNQTMAPGGAWRYNAATTPLGYLSGAPTSWTNTENLFSKQFINYWSFLNSDILLSPAAAALYSSSDQRIKFFGSQPYGGGSFTPSGPLRRVGAISAQFGIMLQDVYLLKAECEARTGDLTNAKTDLETLRKKRMSASEATVSVSDQEGMIRFIINERTREFALLGYRWFDMRRLSVDPLFRNTTYTHQYIKASGDIVTYTLRRERLVMRFPQKVIDRNPGMANNP